MRDTKSTENLGSSTVFPTIIMPTLKSNPKCTVSKCDACQLVCVMKQNNQVSFHY